MNSPMNPTRQRILTLLAGGLALLAGCDKSADGGTNDDTSTVVAFYTKDGRPAVGAAVKIFASSDTSRIPTSKVYTSTSGAVVMPALAAGYYNILVEGDSGYVAFQDSLVSDGKTLPYRSDTLVAPGEVTGRIRVQPNDDPHIAWVGLLGTGLYLNVDDSGRFSLPKVPEGRYTLLAKAEKTGYVSTFLSVEVARGAKRDLGEIRLIWTGLPIATGLAGSVDSLEGTVRLTWDTATTAKVAGWTVWRAGSDDPSTAVKVAYVGPKQTVFVDTLFAPLDTVARYVRYWVRAKGGAGDSGEIWNSWSVVARPPMLAGAWTPNWKKAVSSSWLEDSVIKYMTEQRPWIDTMDGGLAAILVRNSKLVLATSRDGSTWKSVAVLKGWNDQGLYHGGRFWWCEPVLGGRFVPPIPAFSDTIALADSFRVHSVDAQGVDRIEVVPALSTEVSSGVLYAQGDSIALLQYRQASVTIPMQVTEARMIRLPSGSWEASDSAGWWKPITMWPYVANPEINDAKRFDLADGPWILRWPLSEDSALPDGGTRHLVRGAGPERLMPGYVRQIAGIRPGKVVMLSDARGYAGVGDRPLTSIVWASVTEPAKWFSIASPPRTLPQGQRDFVVTWNNRLWYVNADGLWVAEIPDSM